jgi:hypothetical protein
MENLLISIGAETKEFIAGLGEIGEKTKDLDARIKGVGAAAGIAFAGYTAAIMGAVYAYREEEKIGQEVEAILRATGGVAGVTAKAVEQYAEELGRATTMSKEQVAKGEEILLTFTRIGKDVFPTATTAMVDLAQRMGGDTAGAAQLLGRALEDPTNGVKKLAKEGIILTAQQKAQIETMQLSGNIAGAQAIVLQAVTMRYGGLAKAAAGGTGQLVVLKNTMEDFVQGIGKEFAPYIEKGARALIDMIHAAQEHEGLMKFIAATAAAGAAVTGAIATLAAGVFAFEKLSVAMEVAGVVMKALGLSTRVLMGATGIGLIVVALTLVYEYWDKIWPAMKATFNTFVDVIGQAARGLGKILLGAFRLDIGQIKEGIALAADAFVKGLTPLATVKVPNPLAATPEKKAEAEKGGRELANAQAAAAAKQLMVEEDALRKLKLQAERATNAATLMEYQHHTSVVVALKKKEAQILTALADEHFKGDKRVLQKALAETQAEYDAAFQKETKAHEKFTKDYLTNSEKFQKLSAAEQKRFIANSQAGLVGQIRTETDIRADAAAEEIAQEIAKDNAELINREKFGSAYAAINRVMHEEIFEQSRNAADSLAEMTNSKNATMKAVGKGAASVQAAMKTAEGAISAYAALAGIPIVGPGLGATAAGLLTAYGLERQREIWGAAKGGLITGGILGVDSVPVMAQHGELIAPPESYEEVVTSVAAQRMAAAKQAKAGMDGAPMKPQDVNVNVSVSFKGNASQLLTAMVNQDKALGRHRGSSS